LLCHNCIRSLAEKGEISTVRIDSSVHRLEE
jgi:hypothetical protein